MTTQTTQKLSRKAKALLKLLEDGPVTLADALAITTNAGQLHRLADELRQAGRAIGSCGAPGGEPMFYIRSRQAEIPGNPGMPWEDPDGSGRDAVHAAGERA